MRSLAIGMVMLLLAASLAAQQSANNAGVRPLASVKQLHDLMITPASDAVFGATAETPASAKGWLDTRDQALILAEAGNLLMVGSRARDKAGWMKMSRALVDAAAVAAAAAEQTNADALARAGDAITVACETCHRPYRDGGRQMGHQKYEISQCVSEYRTKLVTSA